MFHEIIDHPDNHWHPLICSPQPNGTICTSMPTATLSRAHLSIIPIPISAKRRCLRRTSHRCSCNTAKVNRSTRISCAPARYWITTASWLKLYINPAHTPQTLPSRRMLMLFVRSANAQRIAGRLLPINCGVLLTDRRCDDKQRIYPLFM